MLKKFTLLFLLAIFNLSLSDSFAVEISDVTASSPTSAAIVISWITDSVTTVNEVHYGETTALGSTAIDSRVDDIHWVQISGLSERTTYYYEVESDGEVDNNGGAYYTFTTARAGGYGAVYVIGGRVFLPDATPATGTIVLLYLTSAGTGIRSAFLSTLTAADGGWILDLGNLKHPGTGAVLPWIDGDTIDIFYQGASDGSAHIQTSVTGSAPQDAGETTLPVLLSAFTAVYIDEGVALRWTTQTEIGNIGWNVYRSEKKDGPFVKINRSLIKGAGDSSIPRHYEYIDMGVKNGDKPYGDKPLYYYIESIDIWGNKENSSIIKALNLANKLSTTWGRIKKGM